MQRGLLRAHMRRRYGLPDLLGALLSCVAPLLRHWRSQARVQEAFRVRLHAVMLRASLAQQGPVCRVVCGAWCHLRVRHCKQDSALLGFYDIWVARDINGSLFLKKPPYVSEPAALQRISQGLPFPVSCCWNGLVVLNAVPFLRNGTRLRCTQALWTFLWVLVGKTPACTQALCSGVC